jgi:hypothetical protein
LDNQGALADNLDNMVGLYQKQMMAPPDTGDGTGEGASNKGGDGGEAEASDNGGNGDEAGAGGMPQAGPSTNNNVDGGLLPLPSLPPYTMAPFMPLYSYEKREMVIGY